MTASSGTGVTAVAARWGVSRFVVLGAGGLMSPMQVVVSAFGIAALGGLASLLHSGNPITARTLVATASYSGCIGFSVSSLMLEKYGSDPVPLFGMVMLLGLSGVKAVDLLMFAWKRLGITITATGQKEDDK